jgi:RecA-family ATPase
MNNSFQTEVYNEIENLGSQKEVAENSCFIVRNANDWIEGAKKRPIPNMLFDAFWYEKEVCILFADTNVGKSILAVQICDSISKGIAIEGFRLEVKPQKLVYFDFELSDKQFEKRYSNNYMDHYQFSQNFLRAEINPEGNIPKNFSSFEDYLISSLIDCIKSNNPSVLVIDNITYLKDNNEKAKDALPLMKQLKTICKNHGISILVLAHTPKRDASKPLSRNDLAGSKMLINFCDSAFAIGESASNAGVRYLKQIKQRNTECVYHCKSTARNGVYAVN